MRISNGSVFREDGTFAVSDVCCDKGKIVKSADGELFDATGCIVTPGFFDIHIHGADGADFCDGTREALTRFSRRLARFGVTGFLGTCTAAPDDRLLAAFSNAGDYMDSPDPDGAVMRGINVEGPFASYEKRAVFLPEYLKQPDMEYFDRLNGACGGRISVTDVAPELDGALPFIEKLSRKTRVSLAHTAADYDTCCAGFEAGATNVTHLFNAMQPLGHREPGLVGAAADRAQYVEMICDGIHLLPTVVRAAFRFIGADRVCIVSDAMCACGMPDGVYLLGGQTVYVKNGRAALEGGRLAGSTFPQTEAFRRCVAEFGIPLADALRACCVNPYRAAGISDGGRIAIGERADLTVLDAESLRPRAAVIGGRLVMCQ